MELTQQNREATIATPLGDDVLLLRSMSGSEQLGRPFEYTVNLLSTDELIAPKDIVGQNVTVLLKLVSGEERYFNGFVSRFVQTSIDEGLAKYTATMVPWLWFLTRTSDCRIFQEMTVPDIIKEVFKGHGYTDYEEKITAANYRKWDFCVQYRETDFNFVSRLMEQEGIYYYFTHENGKHNLILADSPGGHEPSAGYEEIKYQPPDDALNNDEDISHWTVETQIQPGSYALNDFSFENTTSDLNTRSIITREHALAEFEIFDYPGEYTKRGDGDHYSKTRIEELQSQYEVAHATSDARGVSTGCKFKLTEYKRPDQNKEYLITSASYHVDPGDFDNDDGAGESIFTCNFSAIDATQQFRTSRTTAKPTIAGPQTAMIVGPSGDEIYTDEYGRVKVTFHWDRHSKADENSSCWIRVAQLWAGKKWGAMYIPRVGQEVIVEFLEGDPDRPIVTGRVYNAQAMPPYDLPGEKTKSTIKSNSSKGGKGFNEIRFEDKKDSEQIFIHAQNNMDVRVLNDRFETIMNDCHLVVENEKFEQVKSHRNEFVEENHLEEIGKDRNLTVKGEEDKEVQKDLTLTVKGDVKETFKKNHTEKTTTKYSLSAKEVAIEGKTKIELKVGSSSITIKPAKIEIKSAEISISGTAKAEVKAPAITVNGSATAEVKGAMVTVSGSAMTEVKGGLVKIN